MSHHRLASILEVQDTLALAAAEHRRARPLDISQMNRVLQHKPEDLTCTVECGCTLEVLQKTLGLQNQWLPLDPPHPSRITLREIIDGNLTGPRRLGFGTVRDYLIGLEVVLPDGKRIHSGGRVVKNVAGYDVHKLFIGSWGTLGVPVVGTFKLLPVAEKSVIRRAFHTTPSAAVQSALEARDRLPSLVAADVCKWEPNASGCEAIIELAGGAAEIEDQIEMAAKLRFTAEQDRGWDERLWFDPDVPPAKFSVLPSQLSEALEKITNRRFIARAGNGIVYHDGLALYPRSPGPRPLLDRLKQAFDPFGVLPSLPF